MGVPLCSAWNVCFSVSLVCEKNNRMARHCEHSLTIRRLRLNSQAHPLLGFGGGIGDASARGTALWRGYPLGRHPGSAETVGLASDGGEGGWASGKLRRGPDWRH